MAAADLQAYETGNAYILANERLNVTIGKSNGIVSDVFLDGQDLLGPTSGSVGRGPYLDCYCTPSGFWTPGGAGRTMQLYSGEDKTGTAYGGFKLSDTFTATGQILEQYIFLREGETGLHMFSRVAYHNETTPFLRNLQELRTLFRPNTNIWTHLMTNQNQYAPLPGAEAIAKQVVVQDATWDMTATPNDGYVEEFADYFTKYSFQTNYQDHKAAGMFADGSRTPTNEAFGAWLVMNTQDTYFGGPLFSDLTVDGIVYNYIASNHHGNQTPNITTGFDRTFGPSYYHFNKGPAGTTIQELHDDATQYADPEWNAEFYDSIAELVPNYVTTGKRTQFNVKVDLPAGAKNAIAILTQNGVYFQDNVFDTKAYQYWAHLDSEGRATIPRVKRGTYRLTVYAEGVFGTYVQDDVVLTGCKPVTVEVDNWKEDSAGTELFRIGTPDKSSGEFRHGFAPDESKPRKPAQHLVYWANWDFPTDFPEGVRFKVGEDDESKDLNYVHWSVFGGRGNSVRPEMYVGNGDINNWTIAFDVAAAQVADKKEATFSVLLAGVKTAAGNTDIFNASEPHSNLAYTVSINGADLAPWVIPYYHSSSCAVRSSVSCYQVENKFVFDSALLREGENEIVLSLPYGATNYEPAILTNALYVQYDALRLEVS
ncbi:rhamnogalacturonan lyase [Plectosphaerella plurivora]|uniref:rhamnogalacturonan endolyase n=1 Tax=Plectosphaerella plurivora TaxID=936078 RepID=A0A9P8V5Y7_9PEZI|nr:rhamnogalacturonan lyase [Plectosphaerella plurivora]